MSRTRRTIGFAITGLIGLGFLLVAWENTRGRAAVRAYKSRLAARGEKFGIDELTPTFSVAARTAANDLFNSSWQLSSGTMLPSRMPGAMRLVAPGKAAVAWAQAEIQTPARNRIPDRATNTWEALGADLARNAQALQEIRQTLKNPAFDAGVNYHQGFSPVFFHLTKVRGIAQWFSADLIYRLHQGEREPALEDLEALLSLTDSSRDERLIISQLVRITLASIAFASTWEALQADGWTDAQLGELQSRWQSLEFASPMERAMQMERAMGLDTFERLRRSSSERRQFFSGTPGGTSGSSSGLAPPSSAAEIPEFASQLGEKTLDAAQQFGQEKAWLWLWSYRDEKRYLEVLQTMLEVARCRDHGVPFAVAQAEGTSQLEQLWRDSARTTMYHLSMNLTPALERAFSKAARIEVQRDLIITAIALKRYQVRCGRPATALVSLVPDLLAAVPRDFMDGRELRYGLNPDGTFQLYSVNEDGKDDGGDPRPKDEKSYGRSFNNGRDLVWPIPASKEEIATEDKRIGK